MKTFVNYCIYPIGNPNLNISKNPYIDNLISAIDQSGKTVINKSDFTSFGIFTLLKYLFAADAFIFNWLESLEEKRFGKLQSVFLPFLMLLLRLLGKKIIVIFHNKHAHNSNSFFSKLNVFFSVVLSSKIVTHAKSGKNYLIDKYGKLMNPNKLEFIYHPVYSSELMTFEKKEVKYDYIIWGTISPYKGIYAFLEFVKNNPDFKNKRILICGKVSSKDFYDKLLVFDLENVKIIDAFITEEKLREYIAISSVILFVYSSNSVLSSGALTKSLNYNKPIVGPRKGAFKDLYEEGLISCFSSYDEIFSNGFFYDKNKNKKFLNVNTWVKLIDEFI
jgi:beta-1,4-mannosyltransferase